MTIPGLSGRAAAELSDEELEAQGTQAHATRNWVFLHGTAEQFARHTSRMLELEQEYLRRHPQRTWQGSGGASTGAGQEAAALREALRAIVVQLEALAAEPPHPQHPGLVSDPVQSVLGAVAEHPGGRMHKLEVQQAAREAGLDRASLAALYTSANPLLATDRQDRVITAAGRARLGPTWAWTAVERAVCDADVARIAADVLGPSYKAGDPLPGDWWSASDDAGHVVGFGWMDVNWGEAEVLLAVDPHVRRSGIGAFVLGRLEREAASRGLNYVRNTVVDGDPARVWLQGRGYTAEGETLRKRVTGPGAPSGGAPPPPVVTAAAPARTTTPRSAAPITPAHSAQVAAERGPGHEDRGGYVAVEDQQF